MKTIVQHQKKKVAYKNIQSQPTWFPLFLNLAMANGDRWALHNHLFQLAHFLEFTKHTIRTRWVEIYLQVVAILLIIYEIHVCVSSSFHAHRIYIYIYISNYVDY